MPLLDAYIPQGALTPEAEEALLAKLTDVLLENEGADPTNPRARSVAWVVLHRPEAVFVAGERADLPRYRVVVSVPEGQVGPKRKRAMVAAVTEAVLDAEPDDRDRDPLRVWVLMNDVPEGSWGAGGQIWGLADIAGFVMDDAEAARAYAEHRLAKARA
ncbi:MAG TPA: tautomerase family protein [Thermoleophilaceae bacterium]|nr:tautomerase family protein [Thermoleophilaceae bacterium]